MSEPLRVLAVNGCAQIGGAERVLLLLLQHLHGGDMMFHVVVPFPGRLSRRLEVMDVPVTYIDVASLKGQWLLPDVWVRLRRRLRSVVRSFDPGLILAGSPWVATVLSLCREAGWPPAVCAVHADPFPKSRLKRWVLRPAKGIFRRGADRWIVVSGDIKTRLVSMGVPADTVDIIHNGVVTPPPVESGKRIRESFGVRPGEIVIAGAGRLHPGKGWTTFCRAAAAVRKVRPRCRFIIFGEELVNVGEQIGFTHTLRDMIRSLFPDGGCCLAGFEPDLPGLLDEVDIFVSTSREESFGLAVLEAMHAGCPVVVSNVSGHRMLLGARGGGEQAGLFFAPGDHGALARHLVYLADRPDRRAELGRAARKLAEEWPVDSMLDGWRKSLRAAAGKNA